MTTLAQIDLTQEGAFLGLSMPLTLQTPVAFTDAEIIALSRRNRPYRIERNAQGELEIILPVGSSGGRRALSISGEPYVWVSNHDGAAFSPNIGFTLPDGLVRSPDASWISQGLYDGISRKDRRRFAHVCPQFVIELLSESDNLAVLKTRMDLWMANGAELAWMIDPYAKTVRVYRPRADIELLEQPEFVIAETVVPGFRLHTVPLWDDPDR